MQDSCSLLYYHVMRKHIILLFLFLIFHIAPASTIDLVKEELFPSLPDPAQTISSYLSYESVHHELLRESRQDTLHSRYTLRSQQVITHFGAGSYSVSAAWTRSIYTIADLFNTPYTQSNIRPVCNELFCEFNTTYNDIRISPQIRYRYSSSADTLFIREFPQSDISAHNTYFYNLLEPTFGDTIPHRNVFHLFHAAFPFDLRYGPDHRFYFSVAYTGIRNDLSESHVNTGPSDVLRGPRETSAKIRSASWELFAGLQYHTKSMFWLSYRHDQGTPDWRHTIFPHEPDTVEIIRLAEGKYSYNSLRLGYQLLSAPLNLQMQGSGSVLKGDIFLSTPVLGYFLRFVPIAHQGTATGSMRYIFFNAYADYPLRKGGFLFTPRMDLIWARIWSDLELDARLQFGLQDIFIENTYIHALYILTPGAKFSIPLWDDVKLLLNIEQMIPIIKTVFPEPPPPPTGISRYGGLTISAGVHMSW